MAPKKSIPPTELPQQPEIWFLAVRQLRIDIELEDGSFNMPHLIILINPQNNLLLATEALYEAPQVEQVRQFLFQAMIKPQKSTHYKPHRPQEVQFEQEQLAEALTPSLAEIDVRASQAEAPEAVEWIIEGLETFIGSDEEELPGLLSIEGVTPELVGELFAAAAEFYRARPWEMLADDQPLAITFSPPDKQGFVQLMGNAGLQFGLVMYWDWEDLLIVYRYASDPLEHLPSSGWHSFSFESKEYIPQADLDASHKYGWKVANKKAYPLPMIMMEEKAERPPRQQLIVYQALLRAIPRFVAEALKSGSEGHYLPAEVEYTVSTSDGPIQVKVTYPAGEVPEDLLWPDLDDLDDDFDDEELGDFKIPMLHIDRRAIEGHMWGSFGQLGSKATDSALNEAQKLMYRAWDEREPRKRIRLAKQAIQISPDCADAYVLLAEEQAQSLEAALELYQKGVQAGERALGQAFFEENAGDFWGLLETRPYMRARQGLAECLAESGQAAEALEHYHDMLRLNPGDNQGIRYSMLALLLSTQQNHRAEELLDQYPDDSFAAWKYSRALLDFRKVGDTPQAQAALSQAVRNNPHVPAYLIGRKSIPSRLPEYMGFGDESEAIHYVVDHFQNWWSTRGAVDWLKRQVADQPKAKKSPKKKATRGKRGTK